MNFLYNSKTNWQYLLIVAVLAVIVGKGAFLSTKLVASFVELLVVNQSEESKDNISDSSGTGDGVVDDSGNVAGYQGNADEFRALVVEFVRGVAESYFNEKVPEYSEELDIQGNWNVSVTIYHQGEIKGIGMGDSSVLFLALNDAVKIALDDKRYDIDKESLEDVRFLIRFFYPPDQFSFIEHSGQGKELIGDLTVVRDLDKEFILQSIEQGKEFLYRMMHEDEHGFYKKYDVLNDSFENRLYTVYSASIIYTFLYVYDLTGDKEILEQVPVFTDFLLSMQNTDESDEKYGAFHYSYFLNTEEKEPRFVVGTSALSIFTLLRMYDLTGDAKYLQSAELAGNWLTIMQNPNGSMKPYIEYSGGKWVTGVKESLLYNGQVLSALSKLYLATGEEKYYNTAQGIAQRFAEKYEAAKGYIEGDYRTKNPISNSWVVMSYMDFYKTNKDDYYRDIIFELSSKILTNQKNDKSDLKHYGGWKGAYSSSGTGWITEVMAETYLFCKEQGREDCEKYKDAVVKAIRWLLQSTYSEENSFILKNPERANGGVFWNASQRYVRTDSVCHVLNGYILIMDELEEGLLLSVPEIPFDVILEKLTE